ncbi:MAG: hypothetical protein K8L99_15745, partial [Anaerolineae bacterium]|nr:hypothetical protein [Anaerolineae bacterium]
GIMVGCQGSQQSPLPTQVDLAAVEVTDAPATATPRVLPPTWTPSPPPTLVPTEPTATATPTPVNFRETGTLYYIFNGDSIVELAADGSFEDLLPIPQLGQPISDLALSPDDNLLAYVAPGNGSAREIYLTDRAVSQVRQLSQLGFARVFGLVWRPDSGTLAFLAAQAPELPQEIYLTGVDGSGQRRPIQRPSAQLQDLAWGPDGLRLYFSDDVIYALEPATGLLSPPLTSPTGFGPDHALVHDPGAPRLYYLKTSRNFDTGVISGVLSSIDTTRIDITPRELRANNVFYTELAFSRDGGYLLLVGDHGITVQEQAFKSSTRVVDGLQVEPQAVFSPDASQVAYVDLDAQGIAQVFVVSRQGGSPTQITFHSEGSIDDLVWAAR